MSGPVPSPSMYGKSGRSGTSSLPSRNRMASPAGTFESLYAIWVLLRRSKEQRDFLAFHRRPRNSPWPAVVTIVRRVHSDPRSMPSDLRQPTELTIDDALAVAVALHRRRDHETAELLYRRILAAAPDHPDALHLLGVVCHERGRHDEAISLIRRAIELAPHHADARNNLANVY